MEIKVREIYEVLDDFAPFILQEDWDNSGLQIGSLLKSVKRVMLALDVTKEAVKTAVEENIDLIISHHPLFFKPIKKIDLDDELLSLLVKNEINVISSHTPLDLVHQGVSYALAKLLDLKNIRILSAKRESDYCKLSFNLPSGYEKAVLTQIFGKGVGEYNLYEQCAFETFGEGRFKEKKGATPFVKNGGVFKESKIDLLVRKDRLFSTISKLKGVHPYQEISFDVFEEYINPVEVGYGCFGELKKPKKLFHFVEEIKALLNLSTVKVKGDFNTKISKVALCGGSGGSFVKDAVSQKADVYLTGDLKYHEVLENDGKICFVDVGHRASELPALLILENLLKKHFKDIKIYHFVENKDFFSYV